MPRHLSSHGSKDVLLCERVQVAGLSRFKLGSYASSFRVTVAPSVVIPERLHSKILVCFHRLVKYPLTSGLCMFPSVLLMWNCHTHVVFFSYLQECIPWIMSV